MALSQNYMSVSRRPPDVEDYIDMMRRYRSWIIGPMFAGLVCAVVVAFLWPDTYISTAVMRITPQQVPERLVPSAVNSAMAERVNAMMQEILSRSSISELIQRPSLDLYKRDRARKPMEDVVEDMRKTIKINMLDTPTGGGGRRVTSAFTIQFSYPDRYKAQAVVRELVTKFTEQNVTVLKNQANLTANFLGDEFKTAKVDMERLDVQITQFKTENAGRLPEQLQTNINNLNSLQGQLGSLNEALNRNQQEKMMLDTQLQNLRNQAAFITANMEELVTTSGAQAVQNERLIGLNRTILDNETRLAASREMYKDEHPNIREIMSTLKVLKAERDMLEKRELEYQAKLAATPTTTRTIRNPSMLKAMEDNKASIASVQVQIQGKDVDIQERIKQQADVSKMIQVYQAKIEMSPPLEQRYAALLRDYAMAKSKYEDMTRRRESAETAQNLEERKAGENLEVLDPASLPEKPSEPNRLVIAAAGTGIGLVLGVVLAAIKEMKDTSLKNLKDVRAYTNLPILSSVPLLENALLVRRKRRMFWLAWSSAIIIGTVAMSGSMYYYYFGHG
jgi:polysaccharide chain length determinant protein (PEP-CTERM system associated)